MTKIANKNVKIILLSLLCLVLAVAMLIKLDVFTQDNGTKYSVNRNGQTFGTIANMGSNSNPPELIAATGIDGTIWYVYLKDLYGEQPRNPEAAKNYMGRLNVLIEEALKRGDNFLWYIPLYESDGITVIGSYRISIPNSID